MTATVPEDFKDLLQVPTAILATHGTSGHPQVTALWFVWDDTAGVVRTSLNDARQKTKNLRADGRATLFILDPANPQRSLEIRGDATLEPDTDFSFAASLAGKYGVDPHVWDGEGETRSVVTLTPVRIVPTLIG